MATDFDTDLDSFTNPTATDKTNNPDHATQHANLNDAVEALEAKVGKAGSAVTTSHDYKLSGVTGSDKAASLTGSETLTDKRITKRVNTTTSSATPSINTDTTDMFTITALADTITSMTTNLTGTPTAGQGLIIRFLDNGVARPITWGAKFASRGTFLPTTTIVSKYLYVGLIWNEVAAVWDCVATSQEV